jgi:hypothetical protein
MATYVGLRMHKASPLVWVIEPPACRLLDLHLEVANHSPTGFEWGYRGSGPAQLAAAILRSVTGDVEVAQLLHQHYKEDVIACLPQHGWVLHSEDVEAWVMQRIAGVQRFRTLSAGPSEWGVSDGEH